MHLLTYISWCLGYKGSSIRDSLHDAAVDSTTRRIQVPDSLPCLSVSVIALHFRAQLVIIVCETSHYINLVLQHHSPKVATGVNHGVQHAPTFGQGVISSNL